MESIDARQFAEHAARYLNGGHALVVEQDGRTLGYYLPVPSFGDVEFRQTLQRLGETVERLLAETGMTEDDLADLLDLSRAFPSDLASPLETETAATHAPRR